MDVDSLLDYLCLNPIVIAFCDFAKNASLGRVDELRRERAARLGAVALGMCPHGFFVGMDPNDSGSSRLRCRSVLHRGRELDGVRYVVNAGGSWNAWSDTRSYFNDRHSRSIMMLSCQRPCPSMLN